MSKLAVKVNCCNRRPCQPPLWVVPACHPLLALVQYFVGVCHCDACNAASMELCIPRPWMAWLRKDLPYAFARSIDKKTVWSGSQLLASCCVHVWTMRAMMPAPSCNPVPSCLCFVALTMAGACSSIQIASVNFSRDSHTQIGLSFSGLASCDAVHCPGAALLPPTTAVLWLSVLALSPIGLPTTVLLGLRMVA